MECGDVTPLWFLCFLFGVAAGANEKQEKTTKTKKQERCYITALHK
jgi:hypothetical protein